MSMELFQQIQTLLQDSKCIIRQNEPMSSHTTFAIGGPAEVFVVPSSQQSVSKLICFCKNNKVPYYIIGKGSNLLVSDTGISGVVIQLNDKLGQIYLEPDGKVWCGSGSSLAKLCQFALENSLSGLEFAWGIPGSVGGAAFMNAGAYGGEMKDVICACRHIDTQGIFGEFTQQQLNFGYRKSVYSENDYCITEVCVQLIPGDKTEIKSKMDDYLNRRRTKQPLEYPSAGSTFKRPAGNYASALIDQCGLRGFSCGGAQVSEKHAGFIINTGTASCHDVLRLIQHIQQKVKTETGYVLECEVKKIGEGLA